MYFHCVSPVEGRTSPDNSSHKIPACSPVLVSLDLSTAIRTHNHVNSESKIPQRGVIGAFPKRCASVSISSSDRHSSHKDQQPLMAIGKPYVRKKSVRFSLEKRVFSVDSSIEARQWRYYRKPSSCEIEAMLRTQQRELDGLEFEAFKSENPVLLGQLFSVPTPSKRTQSFEGLSGLVRGPKKTFSLSRLGAVSE